MSMIEFQPPVFARKTADFLPHFVAGDFLEPRTEIASGLIAMQVLIGLNKALLDEILCFLGIQQHCSYDSPDLLLVPADDLFESLDLAAQDAANNGLDFGRVHGLSIPTMPVKPEFN